MGRNQSEHGALGHHHHSSENAQDERREDEDTESEGRCVEGKKGGCEGGGASRSVFGEGRREAEEVLSRVPEKQVLRRGGEGGFDPGAPRRGGVLPHGGGLRAQGASPARGQPEAHERGVVLSSSRTRAARTREGEGATPEDGRRDRALAALARKALTSDTLRGEG